MTKYNLNKVITDRYANMEGEKLTGFKSRQRIVENQGKLRAAKWSATEKNTSVANPRPKSQM